MLSRSIKGRQVVERKREGGKGGGRGVFFVCVFFLCLDVKCCVWVVG